MSSTSSTLGIRRELDKSSFLLLLPELGHVRLREARDDPGLRSMLKLVFKGFDLSLQGQVHRFWLPSSYNDRRDILDDNPMP